MCYKRIPIFYLVLLYCWVQATICSPIVKIYSYDEALNEGNISKPRIYIQNLVGSEAISNFSYYYYFTTENGKTPVVDDYYTPISNPSLQSLGNGNYCIKFTFTGITLQPGQILPNTSGELVGIHYSDWSTFDKSNDFSNNLSGSFVLNPDIPVFLYDGTPIYGNLPGNPATPPQPPLIMSSTGDFAVFSEEYTDLRDRVEITGGDAGSFNYIELGCDDTLYGTVLSKGNIFLRERAHIYGDVTSGQVVSTQNGVYVQGASRNYAQMELPVLSTPTVTIGTSNVSVPPNGSYTLVPGTYNSFHAFANVSLTILPGEYSFREFILEPNVTVLLNVGNSDFIDLKVRDICSLGNGTNMTLPAGITSPFALSIHSAQTSQLYVGTDATIKGLLYAPDAEVHVYSRTTVDGSVYGRRVVVEPDVKFCKPPTLLGLSHSEGAMAPPFDPIMFKYIAVVPDVTSTIIVTPIVRSGQTVTVNGNSPSDTVNLTGTETDIAILLSHPEACGTTEYKLKVTRSANYMIYVDKNSGCTVGTEDGTTWYTAWKKIEDAIKISVKTGQQICIREGVYLPTERTNPADARSATIIIPCGTTEIVGGFKGTETDGIPLGSAYNTILSGDLNGDDGNCVNWPPSSSELQYVDDNVYHVITNNGNTNCTDSRISNVVISGAYANGTGMNASGAVFVKSGNLRLEFVEILKNYSLSDGAGILVTEAGSLNPLKHCLIKDNYSKTGSGAGLSYGSSIPLLIDGSIFDNNKTESASADQGGSAICINSGYVEMVNCVVGNNISLSVNGAVFNKAGILKVMNCTFAFNVSIGAVSITNVNNAVSDVVNSILWNSFLMDELGGTGFTVSYTCIIKGYTGTNNFANNPEFINPAKPSGDDGKWGNLDDGVRLLETSPCRYAGTLAGAPTKDILEIERITYCFGPDLGAYTFFNSDPDDILGRIVNSVFIPFTDFPIDQQVTQLKYRLHQLPIALTIRIPI